jgi:hypothetical protein
MADSRPISGAAAADGGLGRPSGSEVARAAGDVEDARGRFEGLSVRAFETRGRLPAVGPRNAPARGRRPRPFASVLESSEPRRSDAAEKRV